MNVRDRSIKATFLGFLLLLCIGHFLFLSGAFFVEFLEKFSPFSDSRLLKLISLSTILILDAVFFTLFYQRFYRPLLKLVSELSRLFNNSRSVSQPGRLKLSDISAQLEAYHQNQDKIIAFLEEVGKNNFGAAPDIDTDGQMGQTLLKMRSQLKSAAEAEHIQHWKNQGISHFTKIIREEQESLTALCKAVLSGLVKYMEANQGAIFILEEDEEEMAYLELNATFAWEKEKHQERRFELKQGLTGQAVIEEETIYVTDIPSTYINITSGLGEALPGCLLIVPMMFNEKVHGVIELASFNAFEKHQIALVESIGEILASSVSNIKVNEQTSTLLKESQQMTDILQRQEEELRNNALEMESARENLSVELNKATAEMERQIEAIEQERRKNIAILEGYVDGVITFNVAGNIEFINKAAEQIWNTSRDKVIGKPIGQLIPLTWMEIDGRKMPQYSYQGVVKPIDIRTEVSILNQEQEEVAVLVTISQVNVGGEDTYTIFIQKISVELF